MKRTFLVGATLLGALPATPAAATLFEQYEVVFVPGLNTDTYYGTFAPFNSANGELVSVDVDYNFVGYVNSFAINLTDSIIPRPQWLPHTFATLDVPGAELNDTFSAFAITAPEDLGPRQYYSLSQLSFVNNRVTITSNLDRYIGAPVDFLWNIPTIRNDGPPGLTIDTGGKIASLSLSITYKYIPAVPEPTSWAMMVAGFGITGGAMRRKGRNPRSDRQSA